MVTRRSALPCIAMVAIMLLAVQIPLINQQEQSEIGTRSFSSTSCESASRPQGAPIYVDAVNGSDLWNGTLLCPKSTIEGAVQNASSHDEIVVSAGLYHELSLIHI